MCKEIKGLPQSLELGTKIENHLFISYIMTVEPLVIFFLNHMTVVCVYRVMDDGV